MATITKKNLYFEVRNSKGKLIHKSKNEAKANMVYHHTQALEDDLQTRRERVGYSRW